MSHVITYRAGDTASSALASADPRMAELIGRLGSVEFHPMLGERFAVLVRSVVGQQLSGKAATGRWATPLARHADEDYVGNLRNAGPRRRVRS